MKSIYDIELHEFIDFVGDYRIRRVPGGWNYEYLDEKYNTVCCQFVSYSDEFNEAKKQEEKQIIDSEIKHTEDMLRQAVFNSDRPRPKFECGDKVLYEGQPGYVIISLLRESEYLIAPENDREATIFVHDSNLAAINQPVAPDKQKESL